MYLFSSSKIKPFKKNKTSSAMERLRLFVLLFLTVFAKSSYSLTFKVMAIADKIVDTKSKAFSSFKVIKLQRGKTDLIFSGNHYRFSKDGKFLFRGVCFKSTEYESIWLLYNHFSKGTSFQEVLNGEKIKSYLLPRRIRNLLSIVKPNIDFYENQFLGKAHLKKNLSRWLMKKSLM